MPFTSAKTEDKQPNEARIVPKGSGIPLVQSTLPKASAYSRGPPSRGRLHFHRNPSWHIGRRGNNPLPAKATVARGTEVSNTRLGMQSRSCAPISQGSSLRSAFAWPPVTGTAPIPVGNGTIQLMPTRVTTSAASSMMERNKNKRQATDSEDAPERPAKNSKYSRGLERQTVEFCLPDYCKSNAPGSRSKRNDFQRSITRDFEDNMGAKVIERTIKNDKLVITYFVLDNAAPSPVVRRGHGNSFTDVTASAGRRLPMLQSGSNVKLEDLDFSTMASSLPTRTKRIMPFPTRENLSRPPRTPSASTMREMRAFPLPLSGRTFRSGRLTLTYGPPQPSAVVETPVSSTFLHSNSGAEIIDLIDEEEDLGAVKPLSESQVVAEGLELPFGQDRDNAAPVPASDLSCGGLRLGEEGDMSTLR